MTPTPPTSRITRAMLDQAHDAGLIGLGGAGFSTARKIDVAQRHGADLIVNACDGELGARKDEYVVRHHLDEVMRAASGVTSGALVIAAHRGSPTARIVAEAGLALLEVPRRYVSSESGSLVSLWHGGLARPLPKTRRTAEGALDARGRRLPPTLVLNAETLWRVDQIMHRGAAWFRSYGTAAAPGPRLVTLSEGIARPGVYETQAGARVADILALGGGPLDPDGVITISGLSGGFLTADDVRRGVRWDDADLAAYRLAMGSGVFGTLAHDRATWHHIADVVRYAAGESAGQCGPCMFGLPAVADDLDLVVSDRADERDRQRLRRRLGLLPGRGACHHPDGVARYVRSALAVLGDVLPPNQRSLAPASTTPRPAETLLYRRLTHEAVVA